MTKRRFERSGAGGIELRDKLARYERSG